jgi:hypothetical protein
MGLDIIIARWQNWSHCATKEGYGRNSGDISTIPLWHEMTSENGRIEKVWKLEEKGERENE